PGVTRHRLRPNRTMANLGETGLAHANGLVTIIFFSSVPIGSPLIAGLWLRLRVKESRMRKLILAGLTVCALIMPAAAADIAPYYRGPLEFQPVYWTGAYAGTDVGAAWSNAFGSAGAIGGLYAGYNWEFAPQWLLGVEVDGSWAEFHRMNWLASIRGRV